MKIINKKNNLKNSIILYVVTLMIMLALSFIVLTKNCLVDTSKTTIADSQQNNTSSNDTTTDNISYDKTVNKNDLNDDISYVNGDISITIPFSGFIDNTSKIYKVTTLIDKFTSDGICSLSLKKGGKVEIEQTAYVQALANSSTCKGFTFSTEELSGSYILKITYTIGNQKSEASKEIFIQ